MSRCKAVQHWAVKISHFPDSWISSQEFLYPSEIHVAVGRAQAASRIKTPYNDPCKTALLLSREFSIHPSRYIASMTQS